jgi:hypothetical protein
MKILLYNPEESGLAADQLAPGAPEFPWDLFPANGALGMAESGRAKSAVNH